MEQLDDGMIYFLASLSCDAFQSLTRVYSMFAEGELKGQRLPKSKKSTTSLDLKGSKFKPLRGISEDIVSELLQHLYQKKNINS